MVTQSDQLQLLVSTHLVQTHEIRRCTYLLLAFAHIAHCSVQQTLRAYSRERTVYRVGNELAKSAIHHFPLTLQIYQERKMSEHHLADVDGHGRWLQWYIT